MSMEVPPGESEGEAVATWLERYSVSRTEQLLWVVVLMALVADAALTLYGLSIGLQELNPVARFAIDTMGVFGIVSLKGGAVGLALMGRWVTPDSHAVLVPATLAVPWVVASMVNALTLLTVT